MKKTKQTKRALELKLSRIRVLAAPELTQAVGGAWGGCGGACETRTCSGTGDTSDTGD